MYPQLALTFFVGPCQVLSTWVHILPPPLSGLYNANSVPLIRKIREDLAHWTDLSLSLLRRVNLFKMNNTRSTGETFLRYRKQGGQQVNLF